jgi:hypothetical protein
MSRNTGTGDGRQRPRRSRKFKLAVSRGGTIGIVALAAALAAGGVAAVRLLDAGRPAGNTVAMDTPTVDSQGSTDSPGIAAAGMPQVAATPQLAAMPTRGARTKGTPVPSASRVAPTVTATTASSPTPSTSQASSPSSKPSASAPPTTAGSAACQHPQFQTSDPTGMWNLDPYFVMNDMWGISGYNVTQTLYGCSSSNWYVVATMDNSNGDGHVKTFPNSHRDFASAPTINSFSSITSTFAETSPGTGIYEDAYDIWVNGIASSGSTEVMIWNDNHGQTPAGSVQGTVTLDGRSYTVWKSGTYIAFVANSNFTAATMNLTDFFKWIMSKGWLTSSATLAQVDYGVELVSTNGVPATFTFSNFSVNAS